MILLCPAIGTTFINEQCHEILVQMTSLEGTGYFGYSTHMPQLVKCFKEIFRQVAYIHALYSCAVNILTNN